MKKQPHKVLVASGQGWRLYWPRDKWEKLTAAEQQDVIDRQTALLTCHKVPQSATYFTGRKHGKNEVQPAHL